MTRAAPRRYLPADPADFARSAVPLALVAASAAFSDLRAGVVLLLVVGTAIAIRRDAPVRWTWAAATPVAVSLAFGGLLGPGNVVGDALGGGGPSCIDPASAPAALRAIEAIVVLGVVVALALVLHASRQSIWLRMPARRWVGWADRRVPRDGTRRSRHRSRSSRSPSSGRSRTPCRSRPWRPRSCSR